MCKIGSYLLKCNIFALFYDEVYFLSVVEAQLVFSISFKAIQVVMVFTAQVGMCAFSVESHR